MNGPSLGQLCQGYPGPIVPAIRFPMVGDDLAAGALAWGAPNQSDLRALRRSLPRSASQRFIPRPSCGQAPQATGRLQRLYGSAIRNPFAHCTDRCTLPACRRAIQLLTQERISRRYWTTSRQARTCSLLDGGGRLPWCFRPRGTRCFAESTPTLVTLTKRFSVAMHPRRSGLSLASFPRFALKTRDVAFGCDAQVSARHDHRLGPRGEDSQPESR